MKHEKIILSTVIAIAMILSSTILSKGIITFKKLDRSVVVKGLSEQEHPADLVIWPIGFSLAGNDSALLYQQAAKNVSIISNYLVQKGISANEFSASAPNVFSYANRYGNTSTGFRFGAEQFITLHSTNVNYIREVQLSINELGEKGIVFINEEYGKGRVKYNFTKLNDIKPQMIAEATKAARDAAQQFANDSGSKLGKIKSASQGVVSITDRDENTPNIKKVRVVTTVEYYLND